MSLSTVTRNGIVSSGIKQMSVGSHSLSRPHVLVSRALTRQGACALAHSLVRGRLTVLSSSPCPLLSHTCAYVAFRSASQHDLFATVATAGTSIRKIQNSL